MDTFTSIMQACYEGMRVPMTIYGFTFSWWDVFIWGLLGCIVCGFLGKVVFDFG